MIKFSNKYKLLWMVILLQFSFNYWSNVFAYNCTASGNHCQHNGKCEKESGECICDYGWKGTECQYCSGKVRLTDKTGVIYGSIGNYSLSNKCNWLIDATQMNWSGGGNKTATILISFREFATEYGWDYLYIYDGDSVDSPLLAALSGQFPINRSPKIIARSGSALLHFYSDDAKSMPGFNLSYKMNACPSDNEEIECSGHGNCTQGICLCNPLYSGEACNIAACPNNCWEHKNQGFCNMERCICAKDYGGNDCSQLRAQSVWSFVNPKRSLPPPSTASHAAIVSHNQMYIIGGESYVSHNLMTAYEFEHNNWETIQTENGVIPKRRYGMSTILYGNNIFMYGGFIKGSGISNELWSFDITNKIWQNITVNIEGCTSLNKPIEMCKPLKVTGHTATLVSDKNNNTYMVVLFGHSPQYGYINTVQEYHFKTNEWKIIETSGLVIKGSFGHSAAYDNLTEKIYVYGGTTSQSEYSQYTTNQLYAYSPFTHSWTLLSSAPNGRVLHTANFVNHGLMIVFGGNNHNDITKEYLLVYDVYCDSWHKQNIPEDLQINFERFGHSSAVYKNDIYIYGGFSGQFLNDMLRFSPGNCSYYTEKEDCINSRPGIKCIWDVQNIYCISVTKVLHSIIYQREQHDYIVCPAKKQLTTTNVSLCYNLTNCESCLSNSYDCKYCGNGVCSQENCKETTKKLNIKHLENCPTKEDFRILNICEQLHSCNACAANPDCEWEADFNRCLSYDALKKNSKFICPSSCASLNSCYNCTENDCIWCQNELRCVDRNSYAISFPYGQCREWNTHTSKCGLASVDKQENKTLSSSLCDTYNTCSQCLDDPSCGWCANGSNNGIGKCLEGGALKPHNSQCSLQQWYFTSCPSCNCNGHSKCLESKNCKQPCSNNTIGKHCEKCLNGYWGNPINGNLCKKCECNGQADTCHPETGKCYCTTKGTMGNDCEKCDNRNHYQGDPTNSYCYYELTTDYQFTFNLSRIDEKYFNKIHYHNSPTKTDTDVDFAITCNGSAKFDIELLQPYKTTQKLLSDINCSNFEQTFPYTKYQIGGQWPNFHVTVKDFKTPILIKIFFAQYPKLIFLKYFENLF